MDMEVRFKLAPAAFLFAASATVAFGETTASDPAPAVLAFASSVRNDTDRIALKPFAGGDSKAVFITLADPLSGFAMNSIDARALGSDMGREGEFRFDVAKLIGVDGASALYLGTVKAGNSLIRITLGGNPLAASAATKNGRAADEVPSDPAILVLFGLGFAAFSVARRAGWF